MAEGTESKAIDVGAIERKSSRIAAVLVVGGLLGISWATGQTPPAPEYGVALLGLFGLAKVVVLVLGLKTGWPFWKAVALEILALGAVGRLVWTGMRGPDTVPVVVIVVMLLGGAALLRRKAAG